MLDTIRRRKSNFILMFIVLALVAVMALFGVNPGKDARQAGVSAWVNGEPIAKDEFLELVHQKTEQIRQSVGADERMLELFQIRPMAMNELIQQALLVQQAKKMGFTVPDQELVDFVHAIPDFQTEGKFDYSKYQDRVSNRNTWEAGIRRRLLLSRFVAYLIPRFSITPAAANQARELRSTKMELEYAKLSPASISAHATPNVSQIQAYLSDDKKTDLQAYYDSHTNEFTEKAEVKIRQIRVGLPFQAKEEARKQARAKIEKIAAETTAANFSEKATHLSDDEYARKGGERGWVKRGVLEAPLESALDTLPTGKVSAVIETTFGFFLLLVDEKKPESKIAFEKARETIAQKLATEKLQRELVETQIQSLNAKLEQGKSIEGDLKNLKVDLKKTGSFALADGYIPTLGEAKPILDAVFSLDQKQKSPAKLIQHDGNYYFLRLASLTRPKAEDFQKDLDSARSGTESTLQESVLSSWLEKIKGESKITIDEPSAIPKQRSDEIAGRR